jgi:hypothetical protein
MNVIATLAEQYASASLHLSRAMAHTLPYS